MVVTLRDPPAAGPPRTGRWKRTALRVLAEPVIDVVSYATLKRRLQSTRLPCRRFG